MTVSAPSPVPSNLVRDPRPESPAEVAASKVAAFATVTSTPVHDALPESPSEAAASTTAPSTPVQDPLPESPAATRSDTGNIHWLYLKCVEATVNMDCNLTTIQFAQYVLKKLHAVEDMDDFDETGWDEGAFFSYLFNKVLITPIIKNRCVTFIGDVAVMARELIDSYSLYDDALLREEIEAGIFSKSA